MALLDALPYKNNIIDVLLPLVLETLHLNPGQTFFLCEPLYLERPFEFLL